MKDFINWSNLKIDLDKKESFPKFTEGEIWWCHFGVNVGYELDGKNRSFERPVFVYKKHNENHFLGIALSSSENETPWIISIGHGDKNFSFNFSQIKTMSSKRLIRRIAKISDNNYVILQDAFKKLYS